MTDPVIAQKAPYAADLKAGVQVWWCACGRSAKQPFCDGSHKGTGLAPLGYTPERDGVAYLCGCKATSGAPMCDGTHKTL